MLCAAIDIGSNTTRVLVAEPQEGQLRKVMEQRAYTRIGKALEARRRDHRRRRSPRSPRSSRPRSGSPRSSAPRRSGPSPRRRSARRRTASRRSREIERVAGVDGRGAERGGGGAARLHRRDQDARAPGRGRRSASSTSAAAPPRSSSAPSPTGCARCGRSRSAPASLADELPRQRPAVGRRDPQAPRPHRRLLRRASRSSSPSRPSRSAAARPRCATLVGAVLEYETLERGVRVLCRRPDRRRRQALRARPAARPHPARRRAAAREALRAARPAAADRQGRAARGRHPRPPERRPPTALRSSASRLA